MKKQRAKTYTISAVAEQFELHPQTLRLYEREGLLKPSRSEGNTRLYTDTDLERLEIILSLTRDLGVNLAGVEIILNMREKWMRCNASSSVSSNTCKVTWKSSHTLLNLHRPKPALSFRSIV
jgi:DNA-binding transcriptional MerR regulator